MPSSSSGRPRHAVDVVAEMRVRIPEHRLGGQFRAHERGAGVEDRLSALERCHAIESGRLGDGRGHRASAACLSRR